MDKRMSEVSLKNLCVCGGGAYCRGVDRTSIRKMEFSKKNTKTKTLEIFFKIYIKFAHKFKIFQKVLVEF